MSWSALLVPREHGAWGYVAMATTTGTALSRDLAGLPLLGAAVAALVMRQASVGPGDQRWPRWVVIALASAALFGSCALTSCLAVDRSWAAWLLLAALFACPLAMLRRDRPWWWSALLGASTGCAAAAIAQAGGASFSSSALCAALIGIHGVAMVPLVRACLRGSEAAAGLAIDLQFFSLLLAAVLWTLDAVSLLLLWLALLGLVRTLWLVTCMQPRCSPQRVGVRELIWSLIIAFGTAESLR
ncbi:MAG: hypothetical protein N3B15_05270 [Planctomycetota bacterium]|nr:hypothetical protein [Planctomycetota bacterium]MCX8039965.1 hypothetical protein [Planctomycetota bacterium]